MFVLGLTPRQQASAAPLLLCTRPFICCSQLLWVHLQIFLTAIQLFLQNRSQDVGAAVFDKDDDLAVEFVTAAANLRSIAYNIPTQSLFAAKVKVRSKVHVGPLCTSSASCSSASTFPLNSTLLHIVIADLLRL